MEIYFTQEVVDYILRTHRFFKGEIPETLKPGEVYRIEDMFVSPVDGLMLEVWHKTDPKWFRVPAYFFFSEDYINYIKENIDDANS